MECLVDGLAIDLGFGHGTISQAPHVQDLLVITGIDENLQCGSRCIRELRILLYGPTVLGNVSDFTGQLDLPVGTLNSPSSNWGVGRVGICSAQNCRVSSLIGGVEGENLDCFLAFLFTLRGAGSDIFGFRNGGSLNCDS